MQLNEIVDRGLSTAVTKRFGLTGDATLSLMPELAPVLVIDQEAELQYHLGWRTFVSQRAFAALAASSMELLFQNPPQSNSIMLLEEITVSSAAADFFLIGFPGTANVAPFTTADAVHGIWDGRMKAGGGGALPGGAALVSSQQAAPAFGLTGHNARGYPLLTGTPFTIPGRPLVLVPGTNVVMGFQNPNLQQSISLQWRERALNDQENTL